MNILIDLIVKIFQAIFEEDRKHRERDQQIRARARQQTGPAHGEVDSVGQWFEQLFGEEAVPPPPPPRQQAGQQVRVPIHRQPSQETYEQHLRKFEERAHLQDRRAKALEQHVEGYLGHAQQESEQKPHPFKIPGRNPLEQAVFASVIFGPCKGRQNSKMIKPL